jgi:hypothetical protein
MQCGEPFPATGLGTRGFLIIDIRYAPAHIRRLGTLPGDDARTVCRLSEYEARATLEGSYAKAKSDFMAENFDVPSLCPVLPRPRSHSTVERRL